MFYEVVKLLVLGILRCCFLLKVEGREHVPTAGPLILAANHTSFLDPPTVGASTRRPLYYLAKAELFRIPLFGALIRRVNARPVERGGSDAAALRLALRLLGEGKALLLFPEGTRGVEGVLGPAKAGTGMLALMSGAPVIPIYVRGTGVALPRGRLVPRPARLRVVFGPPLLFNRDARRAGKDGYQAASDEIMDAIRKLKARVDGKGSPLAAWLAMRSQGA